MHGSHALVASLYCQHWNLFMMLGHRSPPVLLSQASAQDTGRSVPALPIASHGKDLSEMASISLATRASRDLM